MAAGKITPEPTKDQFTHGDWGARLIRKDLRSKSQLNSTNDFAKFQPLPQESMDTSLPDFQSQLLGKKEC